MRALFFLFLSFLPGLPGICLAADYPNEDRDYSSAVKTIQLYKTGFELSSPVFTLHSPESITLEFDHLGQGSKAYKFTIRHCTSDWHTTPDLRQSDYLDGYSEENISNFQYSVNTTVSYVHYSVDFPTRNMGPKVSGNYLLIVFLDDPSEPVFTRRFMVTEQGPVSVEGSVQQGSRMDEHLTRQQVDFIIRLNGFMVADLRRELKVVVQQDGRWDNALRNLIPRFVRGDELDFRYDEKNVFNGGSPYRNFDIKSLTYQTDRIDKIYYDTLNQVLLLPDQPRTYKNYVYSKDINGRFMIKNEVNAQNFSIESDYALVHFSLAFPVRFSDGDFYLMGALTSWRMDDGSRLEFNPERGRYEKTLFLKQGYYDYSYVMLKKGSVTGDETMAEGSHWETPHIYTVYVYFNAGGIGYDRLVAVQNLNSIEQK
jgi:hypothetical protein